MRMFLKWTVSKPFLVHKENERIPKERGGEVQLSMKGTLAVLTAYIQMIVILMMSLRMK